MKKKYTCTCGNYTKCTIEVDTEIITHERPDRCIFSGGEDDDSLPYNGWEECAADTK